MLMTDRQTGYPSVDKPWLKWYKVNEEIRIPDFSLYQNIWENNKNNIDDIALHYFGSKISYRELFELIDVAERKLRRLGVNQGDTIAFISIYTPEMIATFYAINKIGAISALMDPRTSPNSLAKYIEKAAIKYAFVQDACSDVMDKVLEYIAIDKIIILSTANYMPFPIKQLFKIKIKGKACDNRYVCYENLKTQEYTESNICKCLGNMPAVICYTGGTTGESKGVLLSNLNVNSVVEQFRIYKEDLKRQQKWLTISVPFIAYSLICSMHMPLSLGMQCYLEMYDNEKMPKTILKNRIHHVAATPEFYEQLLKYKGKDLSFLIMPITGADKLSEKLYNAINQRLKECKSTWKLCNGYGMTEVGSGVCVSHKGNTNKVNSVGIPFVNTTVTAFNVETGEEVKQGEQGEICISGPSVMLGYVADEKATSEVIRTHNGKRWMHTGDIGYIDEDGCVFICGRIKRMIVRFDGFKVFPAFVEEKMLTCKRIDNCSCVAKDDKIHGSGQMPVLFYTLKDNNETEILVEEELRKIAEQLLPSYSLPSEYICVDELPRTHAGKINYRKLEDIANIS